MSSNVSQKPDVSADVADPTASKVAVTTNAVATPTTIRGYLNQVLKGDLGQLPVFVALLAVVIYFQTTSQGLFLTPQNLNNLVLQTVVTATVGLAAVLVLLLGEIDLSLAAVSFLGGAVMTVASTRNHNTALESILAALIVGLLVGLLNGIIITILRVPSFIVTLAGLIFYSGLLLHILLPDTTLRIIDPTLTGITSNYLPLSLGVGLPVAGVALYVIATILGRLNRQSKGLVVPPLWQTGLSLGLVIAIVSVILVEFENYLGVPIMAMILIGLVAAFGLILQFTTFGRHVYAVGGNAEAARRAGINVALVRISIFTLASTLAAVSGILESSYSISASAAVSPVLLLEAIAAAVIGGVSLFGGRGSAWGMLLGALLIGSLKNGLVLKSEGSDIQSMVEGVVLILAVILDAVIRRRNAVTGR